MNDAKAHGQRKGRSCSALKRKTNQKLPKKGGESVDWGLMLRKYLGSVGGSIAKGAR